MNARTKVRMIGLLVAMAALGAAYFFIYSPLQAARSDSAGDLTLAAKVIWTCPGFLLVGLWLLVAGPADAMGGAGEGQGTGKKTNVVLAVLFGLGCVGGYFLYQWLIGQLELLGYMAGY